MAGFGTVSGIILSTTRSWRKWRALLTELPLKNSLSTNASVYPISLSIQQGAPEQVFGFDW